jgi:hypothetical protein
MFRDLFRKRRFWLADTWITAALRVWGGFCAFFENLCWSALMAEVFWNRIVGRLRTSGKKEFT